jgi:1,2-phenylacetyl-CoA epoxidase catalytic subunit
MPAVLDQTNWSRFYPDTPMPRLSVIMAKQDGFAGFAQKVVGNSAATGDLSNRLWTADKMPDAQFMTALRIIRAQASTELGSIQQHRMVYEQLDRGSLNGFDKEIVEGIHRTDPTGHQLDAISFSKKRVCVEELRHHMQMAGVLTLDETFDKARWGRHWATETMEELFAMKPGEHVLDAFNIEFKSLMDSATFMSFIDRVGKFQLEMQHHFLYGPMALSMPWMRFLEESYHLAAGETLMKAIAVAGIMDGGNFGVEDLQKTLNMWYPRGLEMFGSELGGDLVKGVFKTLKNGEAQAIYIDEVLGKVKDVNLAIIQAKTRCTRGEAEALLRRIPDKGETVQGLAREDLIFLPDRRFFRIRGLAEFGDYRMPGSDAAGVGYVYLPYDVHGKLLTDRGKAIERTEYTEYLREVVPERYMSSRHWDFVKDEFLFNDKWGTPELARGS